MVCLRRGLYCIKPLRCDYKMSFWSLCIFEAKVAISGFWGLSGLFINGLVQFDHPYIFNIHGSVPFCRDCWEEEGGCRGLDCGEEGIGRATLKR